MTDIIFPTTHTSNSQLDHMAQVARQLTPQPRPASESFSALDPIQRWLSFASAGIWAVAIFPGVKYAASRTQIGLLGAMLPSSSYCMKSL